ncbi:sterile alpha motif domain-containing protein 3-like [Dermacentor albipictus]|uniref:sterile alpha motif domain-containing protein 3-like n=1 Tax=Dermacentor albipictus TaxID=60249 RepID=UPI0038FBFA03
MAEKQPNTGLQDLHHVGSTKGSSEEVGEYVLPQVPVDIAVEVKTVKKGDVPDRLRRRIVDWIFYDLSSRGMYPKRIYNAAARSLVALYPQLKDSSDNGYFSWLLSLKNKFKNVRKRMPPGCPEVDAQKDKVRMRKLGDGCDQQRVPFRREIAVSTSLEMDPVFVTETINFMKKELSNSKPSMEKLKDAMDRTCQARRKCLEVDAMNIQDFLVLYPALMVEKEILNECSRLTSISPDVSLLQALRKHADGILQAVQYKQPALPTYTTVTTAINVAQGNSKSYARGVGALILLPFLLNERGDDIFAPLVDGRTRPYPTLIFTGDSVMSSEGLSVTFENVQIDVLDVTAGMALLFSMYWAYNIEYVQSAKQTFALLEHLMGIKWTKLSTRAIKVLTKLNACAAEKQQ